MKKFLASTLIFSVLAFGLCVKAETIEQEKGYISVNTSLTKEISPNQAEISIGIETSDVSMQKASNENKTIANNVLSAVKPLLGKDDYIKTGEYSAKPQYIYTKDNKKVFDKYIVKNTVTVKTQNTQIVSKIIDTAISSGANNIDDLKFSATDYDTTCNEALTELTKKAYAQANAVACSINGKITGVKSINANYNVDDGTRPVYDMMVKSALGSAPSTPVESGKIKIYLNINASFYVK